MVELHFYEAQPKFWLLLYEETGHSLLPRVKLATESTHSVQVGASVHDAGPMVPAGLGHWTHF